MLFDVGDSRQPLWPTIVFKIIIVWITRLLLTVVFFLDFWSSSFYIDFFFIFFSMSPTIKLCYRWMKHKKYSTNSISMTSCVSDKKNFIKKLEDFSFSRILQTNSRFWKKQAETQNIFAVEWKMTTSLFFSLLHSEKKHKQGFSFHVPFVSYHLIQFLTSIVFTLWNKIKEEEYNGKSKNNCMEDEKWCIKFKSDGMFANKPRAFFNGYLFAIKYWKKLHLKMLNSKNSWRVIYLL